jgi:hypothetical protein
MSAPIKAQTDFGGLLEAHGVPILSRSGREVRIAASWRGGDGATVSVRTDTGAWYDHKAREGGGWSKLIDADRLALGGCVERPRVNVAGVQEKAKAERKTRVESSRAGWDAADRLDDPLLAKVERDPMLSNRKRAAKTKSMEHIVSMRAYLESRGPGILDAAIRAGARALRATHKLAQGRPCLVWPMRNPEHGQIEGIQREWGRGHDNKKMKGLHMVPVADGEGADPHDKHSCGFVTPPATKGTAADLLFCEGPITTCAGSSAKPEDWWVSLFDTAGMASPPRPVAERAKKKGARRMIFACDGDAAGIKAAAEGARKAQTWGLGLPVFLSIPPMGWDRADLLSLDGICEGVDGREVVRECLERGIREVPPPEKSRTASVWSIQPWRPAAAPVLPAATVPVDQARAIIKTGVQMMVSDYISWLAELDERREQGTKGRLPAAKPWLFKPTTGTGKTTAIKALIDDAALLAAGGSVLALVPDHSQADAYQEDGWWHYRGRNPDPKSPGYCPNYAALMEAVKLHHIPQAEFCHKCPNGLKWAGDYETLSRMGYGGEKLATLEKCVWQQHLLDTKAARFVVAPTASFSETLASWESGLDASGERMTRHRLVTVDEHCQMAAPVEAGLTDIDLWADRLADTLRFLESAQAKADAVDQQVGPTPFESVQKAQDARRAEIAAAKAALDLFKILGTELGRLVGHEGRISVETALLDATRQILDADKDDVTGWERLEFNRDGTLKLTPLRAAWAIRTTLEYGDGFVKNGKLHIAGVRPILDRIGRRPIAFFDATPDPVVMSAVVAHDGHIVTALATQHCKIIRHPTRFWGLKPFSEEATPAQRRRAISQYKAARKLHPNAVLQVHKSVQVEIDPDGEDELLGHWGADHRAHDRWAGRDIVILGSFFPPMHTWRSMYQAARVAALSAEAEPTDWPEWPDGMEMEDGAWITEGGGEVQSYLPLPTDARIRKWLLETVTAETVQAIGRARAANLDPAHPVTIHVYGGVPLYGLGDHGLTVEAYQPDDPSLGASRSGKALDARQAISAAAAAGQRTIKAIQAWVAARFKISVGMDRVRSVMRALEAAARDSGDDIEAIYQNVATRADAYLHQARGDLETAINTATAEHDWLASELLDIPHQADDWGPVTTDPPAA